MRPSGGSDEGFLLALDAAGRQMLDQILDKWRLSQEGPCAVKLTTYLTTKMRL